MDKSTTGQSKTEEIDERSAYASLVMYFVDAKPVDGQRISIDPQKAEGLFRDWLSARGRGVIKEYEDLSQLKEGLERLDEKARERIDRKFKASQILDMQLGHGIDTCVAKGDETWAFLCLTMCVFAIAHQSVGLKKEMTLYAPTLKKLGNYIRARQKQTKTPGESAKPEEFFEKIWKRQMDRGVIS